MNWIKKIFKGKPPEIVNSEKTNKLKSSELLPVIKINISSKGEFVGIDYDFINLLHFTSEKEREEYIEQIKKTLSYLKIEEGMDSAEAYQKLTDYIYTSQEVTMPFLTESLLFKSYTVTKTVKSGVTEIEEDSKGIESSGLEKIKYYYPALKFCNINLKRKIDDNFFDFKFEEQLLEDTLQKNDLYNYARIESLFAFGNAYFNANDIIMMNKIFDRICSEKYDLSESTIANFYRQIGEIYAALNNNEKAIDWLKMGLKLNPKLGVKKLLANLESK
jgi:tetratricopeptide (TPR) repeat protein